MKRSLLIVCEGFFAFSCVQLKCSDYVILSALDRLDEYAHAAKPPIIGALTLNETITQTKQQSTRIKKKLNKVDAILEKAKGKKDEFQHEEQDVVETLRRLELIEKESAAEKLIQLQEEFVLIQNQEQTLAAEIEKIAPGTVPTAAPSTPSLAEPTKTLEALTKPEETPAAAPASSWLWKFVPFAS